MDAKAFARALRIMTPERLFVVGGCVLWPDDERSPDEARVEAQLEQPRKNYGHFTPPAALAARARAAYEHDFNRRFMIRDLDGIDFDTWTGAELAACAEHWAAILRDALRRLAPDRTFAVEVIGAEAADDEPLEVAVTFSQPWRAD